MSGLPSSESTRQTTSECRENAARGRQVNDWFSHEHVTSPIPPSSLAVSAGHHNGNSHHSNGSSNGVTSSGPLSPNRKCQESEQWYRYDGVPPPASSATSPRNHSTPDTQRIQAQQNGTNKQDWYKHGADYADLVDVGVQRSKFKPRRSNADAPKKSDSNEWYRHDHLAVADSVVPEGSADGGSDRTPRRSGASNKESFTSPWVPESENGGVSAEDHMPTLRMKLSGTEAESNYKRDKVGSSSDWYTHDHPADEKLIVAAEPSPTRFRVGKAGQEIADRLKVESDNWFDHDANQNYTAPLPAVKGSSPLTREMIERAKGGEMRQVFQMEQNLKAIWIAPPE